jgi:hypothetical protein
MRKFSGPIGSVSRVTIESQALKSNMLALRVAAYPRRIGPAFTRTCQNGVTGLSGNSACRLRSEPSASDIGARLTPGAAVAVLLLLSLILWAAIWLALSFLAAAWFG